MNNSDKKRFSEIMLATGEIYGKQLTRTTMAMYFDDLSQFTIEEVAQSFKKHRLDQKSGAFFPKPADIVRNIAATERSTEDRANIAWMVVERAIGSVGAYGTLKMDDKLALMAIKAMGSWQQLCHTDRDKLAWKKKEFEANYRALEKTPIESMPDCLLGIEDLANQRASIENQSAKLLKQLDDNK